MRAELDLRLTRSIFSDLIFEGFDGKRLTANTSPPWLVQPMKSPMNINSLQRESWKEQEFHYQRRLLTRYYSIKISIWNHNSPLKQLQIYSGFHLGFTNTKQTPGLRFSKLYCRQFLYQMSKFFPKAFCRFFYGSMHLNE